MILHGERKRLQAQRGRAALLWGLAVFLSSQVLLGLTLEMWRPNLRDPEFGHKWLRLRALLPAHPDQPLLLFLGSSRTSVGVRPALVAQAIPAKVRPLAFNHAISGSGPFVQLLCLRRLLQQGVRPRWIVLEILPAKLNQKEETGEADIIARSRLGWADLTLVRRFGTASPRKSWPKRNVNQVGTPSATPAGEGPATECTWSRSRLVPVYYLRHVLLSHLVPGWLPWNRRLDHLWSGIDPNGWLPYPKARVDTEDYWSGLEWAYKEYGSSLSDFHISPSAKRILRELLEECRRNDVQVILLLMPESSEFRSWYPPHALKKLDKYLRELTRKHGVPLIDARCWLPDLAFSDGHHLLPGGAQMLSERLGPELQRFLSSPSPSAQK